MWAGPTRAAVISLSFRGHRSNGVGLSFPPLSEGVVGDVCGPRPFRFFCQKKGVMQRSVFGQLDSLCTTSGVHLEEERVWAPEFSAEGPGGGAVDAEHGQGMVLRASASEPGPSPEAAGLGWSACPLCGGPHAC